MALDFRKFLGKDSDDEEYIEIDLDSAKPEENKVIVKPFTLRDFDDTNDILNSLRDGYTIAVIDIKPLKQSQYACHLYYAFDSLDIFSLKQTVYDLELFVIVYNAKVF